MLIIDCIEKIGLIRAPASSEAFVVVVSRQNPDQPEHSITQNLQPEQRLDNQIITTTTMKAVTTHSITEPNPTGENAGCVDPLQRPRERAFPSS